MVEKLHYDDAEEHGPAQVKAAWAAVHEARRGINAAWLGVIVNSIVVLTAVGVPFLQQHLDHQKDNQEYAAAKEYILHDMSNSVEKLEKNFNTHPDPVDHPDERISDSVRKALLDSFDQKRNEITISRNILNIRAQSLMRYPELVEFLDLEDGVFSELSRGMWDAQLHLQLRTNLTYAEVNEIIDRGLHSEDFVSKFKDSLLNVKMNTDKKGSPLKDKMKIYSCDMIEMTKECGRFKLRIAPAL